MQIIKETIKKVADIKAHAAKNAAEKVEINGIVFEEGIKPGEVKIESGIKDLACMLNLPLAVGYESDRCTDNFVHFHQWFFYNGVRFFESDFIYAAEVPEGAKIFESKEALYASV